MGRSDVDLQLSISAEEPDLKSGNTLASFQSAGTVPDLRDKLIMKVSGFAITEAASFSKPGGKLSKPVAFFLLRFLSSL